MRAKLVNKDRIIESLDATLRDLEIRACWIVSKEAIEKAIYTDKAISN